MKYMETGNRKCYLANKYYDYASCIVLYLLNSYDAFNEYMYIFELIITFHETIAAPKKK